jgi:hypothetical protein
MRRREREIKNCMLYSNNQIMMVLSVMRVGIYAIPLLNKYYHMNYKSDIFSGGRGNGLIL